MKATELRIGNWALINNRAVQITIDDLVMLIERQGTHWSKKIVQPIPTTEQWLEKFGFEKQTNYSDNNEYIILTNGTFDEYLEIRILNGVCYSRLIYKHKGKIENQFPLRALKYVHILQNCFYYFALTGEELVEK